MEKEIDIIKADTEDELVEKLNKLSGITATQPHPVTEIRWVAFVYKDKKLDNERPIKRNPNWRGDVVTQSQKNKMKELNIPFDDKITKGEAYDRIKEKLK